MNQTKKMTKKNKGGRPKAEIDFNLVESLCKLQCTGEEIASVLKVNYDTLNARIKETYECTFSDYYKKHSASGKASLRRLQFKLAEKSAAMAIFLGKNYLGQSDHQNLVIQEMPKIVIGIKDA